MAGQQDRWNLDCCFILWNIASLHLIGYLSAKISVQEKDKPSILYSLVLFGPYTASGPMY